MSSLFKLGWQDLVKGLVVAALVSALKAVETMLENKGFSFSAEDLVAIGNVAAVSAVGYLVKQLLTDENGKLGGVI